jgi:hypothetical protein
MARSRFSNALMQTPVSLEGKDVKSMETSWIHMELCTDTRLVELGGKLNRLVSEEIQLAHLDIQRRHTRSITMRAGAAVSVDVSLPYYSPAGPAIRSR